MSFDEADDKPIACCRCEVEAAYYVAIEHAIDADTSEAGHLWLCEAHYALWVPPALAACGTSATSKPDDDLADGEYQIDITRNNEDETYVGGWVLCATCGEALWEIAS